MTGVSKVLIAALALGAVDYVAQGTPLAGVQIVQAQSLPAVWQNKAKKLAQNINKTRQSFASNAADVLGDQFKTDQFVKRIENYRSSLAKIPQADDPNLTAATEQLALLEQEFKAAQSGGGTAAAAPAPAPAPATPAPSTTTTETPAPAAPAAASNVRPLVSGERVRVKKMTRDMTNVLGEIKTEGPSLYQDPLEYNAAVKRFTQFTDTLKKYPQADDPDVQAARGTYLKLREVLQAELARGKAQYDILGDVPGNLRALQSRDKEFPIPAPLVPPFTEADVEKWLAASRIARDAAKKDYKYIQDITPIAYLPKYTKSGRRAEFGAQDLPRLAKMTENRYQKANNGYSLIKTKIKSALRELDQQVQTPTARTGGAELHRHRHSLEKMIPIAESAITLERVLGKPTDDAEAALAAIRERRTAYEATREAAIDEVRMPKPVSTDPERLAIAKDVVSRPKYKFGEHGPIILNTAEILEKERKESEIEIDDVDVYGGEIRMSGTQETTVWKWKEFQFATALKEDGTDLWRIYYIKPKYFTSGASTTPLNSWISGGVVEGEFIREENIGK